MKVSWTCALALLLALVAEGCGGGGGGSGAFATAAPVNSSLPPTSTAPPTTATTSAAPIDSSHWPLLPVAQGGKQGRFTTSQTCFTCHASDDSSPALRDAKGRSVAPYDLWQASMMANAARDPLWLASISVETAATPSLKRAIETKCMECHAPMAVQAAADEQETLLYSELSGSGPRSELARDGVSCTLCHQTEPTSDVDRTFDGNYTINDQRELYGPHDQPHQGPMALRTNYLPVKGDHVSRSSACASCHTLTTGAVRADGSPTGGKLVEQSPYLEWRNSVFNDEIPQPLAEAASCQSCHTPTTDLDGARIRTQIAANGQIGFPIQAREPVGRHVFVGGNTLIPQILRRERPNLNPLASDEALQLVEELARAQLRTSTARVSVVSPTRSGDELSIPVRVQNLTGHKFPTGHPVRRAWLRVRVLNGAGQAVFSSGAFDSAGRLVDLAGKVLPSEVAKGPHQVHRDLITAGDQVQIYQSLMQDEGGDLTFLLMRGEGYLKDSRLLPRGWSPTHADATKTAPSGIGTDANFSGGEDTTTYRVSAPSAQGPYTVQVTLLYQTLSARYAQELFQYRTPEVDAFKHFYEAADRRPETVAETSAQLP